MRPIKTAQDNEWRRNERMFLIMVHLQQPRSLVGPNYSISSRGHLESTWRPPSELGPVQSHQSAQPTRVSGYHGDRTPCNQRWLAMWGAKVTDVTGLNYLNHQLLTSRCSFTGFTTSSSLLFIFLHHCYKTFHLLFEDVLLSRYCVTSVISEQPANHRGAVSTLDSWPVQLKLGDFPPTNPVCSWQSAAIIGSLISTWSVWGPCKCCR